MLIETPANSQQEKGDLSPKWQKNWILLTTLMSLEDGPELQPRLHLWLTRWFLPGTTLNRGGPANQCNRNHEITNSYCVKLLNCGNLLHSNRKLKNKAVFIPWTDTVGGNLTWFMTSHYPKGNKGNRVFNSELSLSELFPISMPFTCHFQMNSYSNFKTQVKCCFFKEAFPYSQS